MMECQMCGDAKQVSYRDIKDKGGAWYDLPCPLCNEKSFNEMVDLFQEAQAQRKEDIAEYIAERMIDCNAALHEALIKSKRGD